MKYKDQLIALEKEAAEKFKTLLEAKDRYLLADKKISEESEAVFLDKSFLVQYTNRTNEIDSAYKKWQYAIHKFYELLSFVTNNGINLESEISTE